jgi:hypothetical protein
MGFYINTGAPKDKAAYLVKFHQGRRLFSPPAKFSDIPEDKALIVVLDNGPFEAAGYCCDEDEFHCFTGPDARPRQYVLIDKVMANRLTGFGT